MATPRKENPQKAGRKKTYGTPQVMKEACDRYLAKIDADPEFVPTINGLALELDITRETLIQYRKHPEYSDTLKKVLGRLEAWWEKRLATSTPTGAIFWLKNQDWSDKTQHEMSGNLGTLDNKQLDERIAALMSNPELMGSIGPKKEDK